MATLGEVHDVTKEFNFEWEIKEFFSIPEEVDKRYRSQSFPFAGESWFLEIIPYASGSEYVGVYIFLEKADTPFTLTRSFSLKTSNGKTSHEKRSTQIYNKEYSGWGWREFAERSTLLEKKSELVPSDVLTIIFIAESFSKSADDKGTNETVMCTYCKKTFIAECLSTHEQKCLEKPIRCQTCRDAVALKNWFDHECETARVKANEKLVKDLEALINSEEQSDVTIKVKDKEFRLHWSILAGRNPYFSSMVKAEMKEATTGVITIHDCEPDIFHSFIYFLYTGKLETPLSDNVCALYKVADKYQEDQVKVECLNFMKKKISVENFCDFVVLSLTHDEKELLQDATEFFCKNVREIIKSAKWQTFLRDYPTQANELNLKAFDFYLK